MLKRLALGALLVLALSQPARADFEFQDIACETSTTAGTGTLDLDGALTGGYLGFLAAGIDSGDTVPYHIKNGSQLETGIGTFTDGTPDTLSRTAYLSTDGSGAELTLSGTSTICIGPTTQIFTAGVSVFSLDTVTIATEAKPDADDGAALGVSNTAEWSDLFLNTGAVIGWENGDVTLTHSADTLTLAGGDLVVPTEAYDESGWDADNSVPTKDAVRDKFESLTGGMALLAVQSLTSGTGATFTPNGSAIFWKVTCTGGGGGGGGADNNSSADSASAAGGGEAGGTAIAWFDATEMGANATYTIGPGGGGGNNAAGDGTDGTDTTFNPAGTGATITGAGGDGGDGEAGGDTDPNQGSGGTGEGTATNGDLNLGGGDGQGGAATADADTEQSVASGGLGGASFWGGGGGGAVSTLGSATAGPDGSAYGSGGGGAAAARTITGAAGGDGAAGICVVEEFG